MTVFAKIYGWVVHGTIGKSSRLVQNNCERVPCTLCISRQPELVCKRSLSVHALLIPITKSCQRAGSHSREYLYMYRRKTDSTPIVVQALLSPIRKSR
jgi:hypothetical protein